MGFFLDLKQEDIFSCGVGGVLRKRSGRKREVVFVREVFNGIVVLRLPCKVGFHVRVFANSMTDVLLRTSHIRMNEDPLTKYRTA